MGYPGQIRKNPWGWPNLEAQGRESATPARVIEDCIRAG